MDKKFLRSLLLGLAVAAVQRELNARVVDVEAKYGIKPWQSGLAFAILSSAF